MGAGVLLHAGSDEQKQHYLPRLAAGETILSVAWLEPGNGFGGEGVQATARADGDDFVLDGVKYHVPYASAANERVVLARTTEGIDLSLVDPASPGVSTTQQLTIASDTQYAVELSG